MGADALWLDRTGLGTSLSYYKLAHETGYLCREENQIADERVWFGTKQQEVRFTGAVTS